MRTQDGEATGIDEAARERLRIPQSYQGDIDRECDVVMKGGITSGVLYPLALCELAKTYRLRNIGGTSAGAIAAAAAAAAEYGRHDSAPTAGFQGLAAIPDWSVVPGNLVGVFAPAPSTKPLHGLLLAAIAKPAQPVRTALQILRNAFAAKGRYLWIPLLPILIGIALLWTNWWGVGWDWLRGLGFFGGAMAVLTAVHRLSRSRKRTPFGLVATAVLLIAGAALAAYCLVDAVLESRVLGTAFAFFVMIVGGFLGAVLATILAAGRVVSGNLFGIVSGSNPQGTSLSDWLSGIINELAGLDKDGPPLTFGQLRAGPPGRPSPDDAPFVNLEMLTTAVTLGRAMRMPDAFGAEYFYDPVDFDKYFPTSVMDYLNDWVDDTERSPSDQARYDEIVARARRQGLRPLPTSDGLPVIVATRMSLSFPVLLSAVRLYSIDYATPDVEGGRPFQPCWFSDGGVTSNFPITFFDSLLPSRPTFGINLRGFPTWQKESTTDQSKNIWMPTENDQGILDWWTNLPTPVGIGSLFGFFGLILNTMQNWVDNEQSHVSGFRDRIVTIYHSDDEGGMNLDMPKDVLIELSERGRAAGDLLVEYYTTEEPGRTVSWANHRWIRVRNTLAQLEKAYIGAADTYPAQYEELVNRPTDELPSYKWRNETQRSTAIAVLQGSENLDGIVATGRELRDQVAANPNDSLRNGSPSPTPDLVSRPGQR